MGRLEDLRRDLINAAQMATTAQRRIEEVTAEANRSAARIRGMRAELQRLESKHGEFRVTVESAERVLANSRADIDRLKREIEAEKTRQRAEEMARSEPPNIFSPVQYREPRRY